MMIDVEIVEQKNSNYLGLLFILLCGFIFGLKNIFYNMGLTIGNGINISLKKNTEENYIFSINESLFNLGNNVGYGYDYLKYENNIDYLNLSLHVNNIEENNFFNIIGSKGINNGDFNINRKYELIDNINNNFSQKYIDQLSNNSYLLINPNWDYSANRITQITSIGDVLYSTYHSYIYIVSMVLLLAMVGAIVLTGESKDNRYDGYNVLMKKSNIFGFLLLTTEYINNKRIKYLTRKKEYKGKNIMSLFGIAINEDLHSTAVLDSLSYYFTANLIIALLLLLINSYFSLSVKYLDKGGGFECGFTSFAQTRERFNVIFYRVSLLFLIFDLEIILAFPYTAILQKNQNISKNNVLAFLYILVVGFIYELKEGALNIWKKVDSN